MVALDDLSGLFQPLCCYDSMIVFLFHMCVIADKLRRHSEEKNVYSVLFFSTSSAFIGVHRKKRNQNPGKREPTRKKKLQKTLLKLEVITGNYSP